MKQTLILFFLLQHIYGQNLLKNPSFESRVSAPDSVPNDLSQFRFLDDWDEDMNDNRHDNDGNKVYLHSPDFYSSTYHNPPYIIDKLYGGQPIYAQDGDNYVGMSRGELIEQEFEEVELEAGKAYHIEFYLQPSKAAHIENISWNNYTTLSLMLTKSKLEYTSSTNHYSSRCTSGFNDHISENNSTLHISDMQISTTQYPFGVWTKVSIDFTAPSDVDEYDWFVVETNDPNSSTCDTYLLLDDFSLFKEGCEPTNCSQTSGEINSFIKTSHSLSDLWYISGLENVSHCKIEISNILSQIIIKTIEINATNGIKNPIYWDGKTDLGQLLTDGTYLFTITLDNECITNKKILRYVEVQNSVVQNPMSIPSFTEDNSSLKIPKLCCQYDLDIENRILDYSSHTVFSASNNVIASKQSGSSVIITSNSDITFQAGNSIELGPGFETQDGAVFETEIGCPQLRFGSAIPLNQSSFEIIVMNSIKAYGEEEKNDKAIKPIFNNRIYPNPVKSTLSVDLKNNDNSQISISDLLGKIVFQTISFSSKVDVDVSTLPNGIYFLKATTETETFVQRFVKE